MQPGTFSGASPVTELTARCGSCRPAAVRGTRPRSGASTSSGGVDPAALSMTPPAPRSVATAATSMSRRGAPWRSSQPRDRRCAPVARPRGCIAERGADGCQPARALDPLDVVVSRGGGACMPGPLTRPRSRSWLEIARQELFASCAAGGAASNRLQPVSAPLPGASRHQRHRVEYLRPHLVRGQ